MKKEDVFLPQNVQVGQASDKSLPKAGLQLFIKTCIWGVPGWLSR